MFITCPSVLQIQDLGPSKYKCGFSKKAFRRQYFLLFPYVLLSCYHHLKAKLGMSNFAMGTIMGKGFPQALVHTVHSTRAFVTCAMNCMHLCLWKTLSQDCPHGEIRHSLFKTRLKTCFEFLSTFTVGFYLI